MTRRRTVIWLPWLLGALTLLVLANMIPDGVNLLRVTPQLIIMVGVVAFMANVEVPLQGDGISLGYPAALLTYLTINGVGHKYEAFGAVAVGGAIGGLLRALWRNRELGKLWQPTLRLLNWPLLAVSQLVLSIAAGDLFYRHSGGRLPLTTLDVQDFLPLILLAAVSIATYLALYSLSVWSRGLDVQSVFRHNWLAIGLAMVLPVPFVVVTALLAVQSLGGFILLLGGLLVLAIGATALGRGQLQYREQLVELQSLSSVSRSMRAYLDLPTLLNTLQLQVATLLNVEDFSVVLFDPARNALTYPLIVRRWQPVEALPEGLELELISRVITTKAPLLIGTNSVIKARSRGKMLGDGLNAWLGVPLLATDRALGCIAVSHHDPLRRFTERDQRMLVTIAAQSSIAIENAQLYKQVQERARQLTRLNNLAAQLSGTLDPLRVLDTVTVSARAVANAAGAVVFMWQDEARTKLTMARCAGLSANFEQHVPLPLSMGKLPQPLVIQNVQVDAEAANISEFMLKENVRSWMELPLANGDDQLGILAVYFSETRRFLPEDIELMRAFANQAALSISNARLYSKTDEALIQRLQQLSALAAINKELSSTLNINRVFSLVLDRAIEATGSTGGVFILNDPHDNEPGIVAVKDYDATDVEMLLQQPVVSQTYATGKPTLNAGDGHQAPVGQLGVPLVRDYEVLGVIMVVNPSVDSNHSENVAFVSQLATQAIIAMDNARLFEWMTASRNRLQVILDSMQEAVLMFELDERVALANPRVQELLGLDVDSIVGQRVTTLLNQKELLVAERLGFEGGEIEPFFEQIRSESWSGLRRQSYRLELQQTTFIDRTIVPVLDQDNKTIGLLMVFTDATEERELAQAREDLSRMIVHDLRSPLTAINASMKLLTEMDIPDTAHGSLIRKTTDISQRALRKLLYLVDSLLDIAKMESGNISLEADRVDLHAVAEGVRGELLPLAEELEIDVQIGILPTFPRLIVDGNKIERVLLNLVDNALKFAPVGGVVRIDALLEGPDMVRVNVIDNGPGVPDDYKHRIFDRFQQADQRTSHRRGTGLGLTFCRLTVEAHGGEIWIEDNPGGGSVFAFTLPLELAHDKRAETMQEH